MIIHTRVSSLKFTATAICCRDDKHLKHFQAATENTNCYRIEKSRSTRKQCSGPSIAQRAHLIAWQNIHTHVHALPSLLHLFVCVCRLHLTIKISATISLSSVPRARFPIHYVLAEDGTCTLDKRHLSKSAVRIAVSSDLYQAESDTQSAHIIQ